MEESAFILFSIHKTTDIEFEQQQIITSEKLEPESKLQPQ